MKPAGPTETSVIASRGMPRRDTVSSRASQDGGEKRRSVQASASTPEETGICGEKKRDDEEELGEPGADRRASGLPACLR